VRPKSGRHRREKAYERLRGARLAQDKESEVHASGGTKGRNERHVPGNLKNICEKELPGRYKIEVVDVSKNPRAAVENNLAALPAVFRTMPAPVRKFVGNWANEDSELVGFELVRQDKPKGARRSRSSNSHKKTP
jgi:KaiB domain